MTDASFQFKIIRRLSEDHGGWLLGALAPKDKNSDIPIVAAVADTLTGKGYAYAGYHQESGALEGSPQAKGDTSPVEYSFIDLKTQQLVPDDHLPPSIAEALVHQAHELDQLREGRTLRGKTKIAKPDTTEPADKDLGAITQKEISRWSKGDLDAEAAKLAKVHFEELAGQQFYLKHDRVANEALDNAQHYARRSTSKATKEDRSWAADIERQNEARAAGQGGAER